MKKDQEFTMLRRVNLNLLYSMYALLNSENLSQAARMVSLTQPAMSQALKRLREEYDDDLIYQERGERRLTPLAKALKPRVEQALKAAKDAFDHRLDFDPALSTRTFTIAAPESILTVFLAPFVTHLQAIAPGVRLSFVKLDHLHQSYPFDQGADLVVSSRLDPGIGPHQQLLCGDYIVGLACKTSTSFGEAMSLDQLASADLVGGEGGVLPLSLLPHAIRNMVEHRGFEVTTDSLASLPRILAGSEFVALTSCWLAQYYAAFHPLKIVGLPPKAIAVLSVVAEWHPRQADDPGIAWLVDRLVEEARSVGVPVEGALPDDPEPNPDL